MSKNYWRYKTERRSIFWVDTETDSLSDVGLLPEVVDNEAYRLPLSSVFRDKEGADDVEFVIPGEFLC